MTDDVIELLRDEALRRGAHTPQPPGADQVRRAASLHRRRTRVITSATVVLALAALSLAAGTLRSDDKGSLVADPGPKLVTPADPLSLVGRWFVDVPGEEAGMVMVLGEELSLFRNCGILDGEWKADGEQRLFVANTFGGDPGCFGTPAAPPRIRWLERAVGFRVDGETRRLVDSDGRTVAVLSPGAEPTVGPNRAQSFASPPVVTPAMRDNLRDATPLPDGVSAPDAGRLDRRWIPIPVSVNGRADLRFGADGIWQGSDGCNGAGGRFVVGDRGRLLATGGAPTAIGCNNVPVGSWMTKAGRLGLVDDQLVLYDNDAKVLGRLAAAPRARNAS